MDQMMMRDDAIPGFSVNNTFILADVPASIMSEFINDDEVISFFDNADVSIDYKYNNGTYKGSGVLTISSTLNKSLEFVKCVQRLLAFIMALRGGISTLPLTEE